MLGQSKQGIEAALMAIQLLISIGIIESEAGVFNINLT